MTDKDKITRLEGKLKITVDGLKALYHSIDYHLNYTYTPESKKTLLEKTWDLRTRIGSDNPTAPKADRIQDEKQACSTCDGFGYLGTDMTEDDPLRPCPDCEHTPPEDEKCICTWSDRPDPRCPCSHGKTPAMNPALQDEKQEGCICKHSDPPMDGDFRADCPVCGLPDEKQDYHLTDAEVEPDDFAPLEPVDWGEIQEALRIIDLNTGGRSRYGHALAAVLANKREIDGFQLTKKLFYDHITWHTETHDKDIADLRNEMIELVRTAAAADCPGCADLKRRVDELEIWRHDFNVRLDAIEQLRKRERTHATPPDEKCTWCGKSVAQGKLHPCDRTTFPIHGKKDDIGTTVTVKRGEG